MTEGERAKERTQRRGCVDAGEDAAHSAVAQQCHVVDAVGAGNHPRDERGHLQPGVGPLVGRDRQVLLGQLGEPGGPGQREDRDQAGRRHEIRIIEHCRGRARRVAKLHLRDALRDGGIGTLKKSDFPST